MAGQYIVLKFSLDSSSLSCKRLSLYSSSSSSSTPTSYPQPEPQKPNSEAEAEAEALYKLIPFIPDDVALNCLARVPRSQHRTLSRVSKPIRSLLPSPLFFNTRFLLHSTQHIIYVNIFDLENEETNWFTVYQNPNDLVLVPKPPIPSHTRHAGYAVEGPNIYVIGGSIGDIPSPQVWVLDCRFNRWQPGPPMLVGRDFPAASVVDGKIYVIGGSCHEGSSISIWAEVLDPALDRWEEVPCPCPFEVGKRCMRSVVVDDKIYVWNKEMEALLVYDPRNKVWESIECDFDLGWTESVCVVDEVVYAWVNLNIIKTLHLRQIRQGGVCNWKELKGLDKVFKEHWTWWPFLATLTNVGGNLLLVWISQEEIWCAQVEVIKDGDAELWSKVCWSRIILSHPLVLECFIEHCSAVVL